MDFMKLLNKDNRYLVLYLLAGSSAVAVASMAIDAERKHPTKHFMGVSKSTFEGIALVISLIGVLLTLFKSYTAIK
jgi:uncharacterized membrane protein